MVVDSVSVHICVYYLYHDSWLP